uniref:Uncharacterized protein n=1 Tax=Anguilla anguilla TaxID=7936 RepID=A0A0E9ST56_ANGAN
MIQNNRMTDRLSLMCVFTCTLHFKLSSSYTLLTPRGSFVLYV